MGNFAGFKCPNGDYDSISLGANGSGYLLLQQFAVAYAATNASQAARARRYVHVRYNADRHNTDIPSWIATRQDVLKVIALDGNESFWTEFGVDAACRGFFQARPSCPIYRGVMIPLVLYRATGESLVIPSGVVGEVAHAWNHVLPQLERFPARRRVTALAGLATRCAASRAHLEIG